MTQPVALITGAGSGIGRDTALLLAEAGFKVALAARSMDKLQVTAEDALQRGAETLIVPVDLADAQATRGVIPAIIEKWGRIDAIANVAGFANLGPIEKLDAATVQHSLAVNLMAIVHLTATAWPHFRSQKLGIIVNVSSMASIDPFPGFGIYAPAKAAVNMFTRCTADEGKKLNIRAVAIAPGAVETPMLRSMFNEKMIPQNKTLDPMEVGALIRDCITGKRSFTSGETIVLNPA